MLRYLHALRYLWEVHSLLPVKGKRKRKVLSQVGASVWDYVTDTPGADLQRIKARFGEPEKIALDHAGEMDPAEILAHIQDRKSIFRVVAATALLILAIWACVVGYAWSEHKINDSGYCVDEFFIIDETGS